jgi:hypothetical protein
MMVESTFMKRSIPLGSVQFVGIFFSNGSRVNAENLIIINKNKIPYLSKQTID